MRLTHLPPGLADKEDVTAPVLDKIPIDQESKAVLLGGAGRLQPFYRLMLAQESGEWKTVTDLRRQLQLNDSDVAEAHSQALQWARRVNAGT
jgi:c-di-GMP-related signal transduction protein